MIACFQQVVLFMNLNASERLLSNTEKIMSVWEKRVRQEIPSSNSQSKLLLRDEIPEQLNHLAVALSTTIDRTKLGVKWELSENIRLGKSHGKNRAQNSLYSLDQLIFEYHILREVICAILEEEQSLSIIEREIITSTIEQSVNDASTEFVFYLRNIQQELIYTLAHDLRSPVTAVKLIAQNLEGKLSENNVDRKMVVSVIKNINRVDSMIQDLLDVGRLESGASLSLDFKECDLNAIIIETLKNLNFMYNNRFQYISSGECLGLWSEKGIERLIENLASNAIKYGQPNTDIIVTLDNTGTEILFSIRNEGLFILLKDQTKFFNLFERSIVGTDKIGWGVGLKVVEAMVSAHKGSIEVESIEGKGTTFIVKFPKLSTLKIQ